MVFRLHQIHLLGISQRQPTTLSVVVAAADGHDTKLVQALRAESEQGGFDELGWEELGHINRPALRRREPTPCDLVQPL